MPFSPFRRGHPLEYLLGPKAPFEFPARNEEELRGHQRTRNDISAAEPPPPPPPPGAKRGGANI